MASLGSSHHQPVRVLQLPHGLVGLDPRVQLALDERRQATHAGGKALRPDLAYHTSLLDVPGGSSIDMVSSGSSCVHR